MSTPVDPLVLIEGAPTGADPTDANPIDDSPADPGPPAIPLLTPREGVPTLVTTPAALDAMVAAIAGGTGPIAIDAERASGYRYSMRAYLVQLRRVGSGSWLIDPIECPDPVRPRRGDRRRRMGPRTPPTRTSPASRSWASNQRTCSTPNSPAGFSTTSESASVR